MAKALRGGTLVVAEFRPRSRERWFPWMSLATGCLLLAPVLAALIGTFLPAFGYFPLLGGNTINLDSWRRLFESPGLGTSVRLSLVTGLVTTVTSLTVVTAFCAAWHGTRLFTFMERLLAPMLAIPHVAVAFGLAFLLAPSGWILRSLSPWATGFTQPPDWLIVQDGGGVTLILGLIAKEVPFLLIMTLAALGQVDAERSRMLFRTLGYRPMNGWLKAIFPRVYPQIRLPIFAVLAYGISVVDVATILGPTTPAPLAVRLVRMFNQPDLEQRFIASAGAILQLGLVALGVATWLAIEVIVRRFGTRWISSGDRGRTDFLARSVSAAALSLNAGAVLVSLLSMVLWSFAESWRFPDALPSELTLANWMRNYSALQWPLFNTVTLGAGTVVIALALAVGVLEREARSGRRASVGAQGMLYLPLIIPQVATLFGAQILLVMAQLDGRWIAVVWTHLVFVFPYVFLSLADAYRAWDERYQRTALCLGATPMRVFLRIKFPMLLRPMATAGAVGFAVSAGLYLPTLFAGSGRIPTLITESVALSAGGDNRLVGIYALLQMTLPLIGFTLAAALPGWLFRDRRGMQVTR